MKELLMAQQDAPEPALPRMNILMVDDQADGLLALEAVLAPLEQNLVRASSGREALRLLLREDFALILLDVVMPGMDGFECAQLIRERPRSRHTPIIFLTAARKGEGPLQGRGYETGAVDFIYKPIDPEVLRSKVRVFVELARKTREIREQSEALQRAREREHERELQSVRAQLEADRLRREMDERKSQQEWLEALLGSLPRALLLTDRASGKIIFSNRAAAELMESLNEPGHPIAQPDSPLMRAARGEELSNVQIKWPRKDGERTVLVWSTTLPALHGRGDTMIIPVLDITELKETEDKLQRAVRSRDEFMSAASHELNTPLTTIVLQLDSLTRHVKKALPDDPRAQRTLATLSRNVERLSRLVSEMLDVTRIAEGRLRMHYAEMDLAELAREVAARFEEQMARVGCKLELAVDGPSMGVWDRSRLDQVITNLLTNAMKYAPGKPVEIAVAGDADAARFVVRDHGIGIAPEHHARIFERFERAVPTDNYAGMGIGLWIVSRIVGEMGGGVSVQSEAGQGACFTVTLPRARPAVEPSSGSGGSEPHELRLIAGAPNLQSSEVVR